jgi:hypothetical protein
MPLHINLFSEIYFNLYLNDAVVTAQVMVSNLTMAWASGMEGAKILNKQLQTFSKGWSSSPEVGQGTDRSSL